MINENTKQYCWVCDEITNHIPKLSAVMDGKRVCDECRICNNYHDSDELLKIYRYAFRSELNDVWIKMDFFDENKTKANDLGRIHAVLSESDKKYNYLSDVEIIKIILNIN